MKKIILAFALLTPFVSCKDQEADPKGEVEEEKVQLTRIIATLHGRSGSKSSSSDFELIYNSTGKLLEKINQTFTLYGTSNQVWDSQKASFLIEYNTNNTVKSVQIVPDNSGKPYLPAAKYNFIYAGALLDSYQKEGSGTVSFKYDETGNIIKRVAGNSENNYAYLNNTVTNSAGISFEFGDYKNPLTTMDKGLAMILGNELYAGNSEPVNTYSKFLTKVVNPGKVPNMPPSPTYYYFKVYTAKDNYPLNADWETNYSLSPEYKPRTALEYEYKNL